MRNGYSPRGTGICAAALAYSPRRQFRRARYQLEWRLLWIWMSFVRGRARGCTGFQSRWRGQLMCQLARILLFMLPTLEAYRHGKHNKTGNTSHTWTIWPFQHLGKKSLPFRRPPALSPGHSYFTKEPGSPKHRQRYHLLCLRRVEFDFGRALAWQWTLTFQKRKLLVYICKAGNVKMGSSILLDICSVLASICLAHGFSRVLFRPVEKPTCMAHSHLCVDSPRKQRRCFAAVSATPRRHPSRQEHHQSSAPLIQQTRARHRRVCSTATPPAESLRAEMTTRGKTDGLSAHAGDYVPLLHYYTTHIYPHILVTSAHP